MSCPDCTPWHACTPCLLAACRRQCAELASPWLVRCSDGVSRHPAPFASRAEAWHFAEWGHCCTARHTLERVPS